MGSEFLGERRESMIRDRRPDEGREVMTVGRRVHPEPERARIDAPFVQVMQVPRNGGRQSLVEGGKVSGRGTAALEQTGDALQLGRIIVSRVKPLPAGGGEQRQRPPRLLVQAAGPVAT
jgi:hypothetical protein